MRPHRSPTDSAAGQSGVRLQRVLADAGVASRRACEELIAAGRVTVNGQTVSTLPAFVDPATDRIAVDGRPVRTGAGATYGGAGRGLYIMLNKPARSVTTARDEYGRRTVLDMVTHPAKARLFPVGRLDFETTGLLLFTNDGELAHRLTHAKYGITKTFRIEVKGSLDEGTLRSLEREVLKAGKRRPKPATPAPRPLRRPNSPQTRRPSGRVGFRVVSNTGGRTVLEMTLAEGRNRQVMGVLRRAGYPVKKVTCVGMGPLELKGIAAGEWRELDRREVRTLKAAVDLVESGRRKPGRTSGQPARNATVRTGREAEGGGEGGEEVGGLVGS